MRANTCIEGLGGGAGDALGAHLGRISANEVDGYSSA